MSNFHLEQIEVLSVRKTFEQNLSGGGDVILINDFSAPADTETSSTQKEK